MKNSRHKVGDVVFLDYEITTWGLSVSNPAKTRGKVLGADEIAIRVLWENGQINYYRSDHTDLLTYDEYVDKYDKTVTYDELVTKSWLTPDKPIEYSNLGDPVDGNKAFDILKSMI